MADGRLSGTADIARICTISGLAQSNSGDVKEFLAAASKRALVSRKSELTWQITNPSRLAELAPLLSAIELYRSEVHKEVDTVEVVLTKPPKPSQIAVALEKTLLGNSGLLDTRELLPVIAEKAVCRFAVMTPYLDETGAEIVLSLFRNAKTACRKQLILRTTADGDLPPGFPFIATALERLGVETFNFRLDKVHGSGHETFHAKIVIADNTTAYVGSANMNKWSFAYSLELGLMVSGKAAARIGEVVDAVIEVSVPVTP